MSYYFSKILDMPFDEAIQRVVEALKQEGFGVLTDIDVKATLRKKLGVGFRNYRILGACNAPNAYEALKAEDKIGTMLPCSVIVQETPAGAVGRGGRSHRSHRLHAGHRQSCTGRHSSRGPGQAQDSGGQPVGAPFTCGSECHREVGPMLLCIDVGNTNITLGLYEGETLGPRWRLATDHERMPDEFILQLLGLLGYAGLDRRTVSGAAIASVVPTLTGKWVEVCRKGLALEPLVMDGTINTGVRILYEEPGTVGADRLVDAVAAYRLYGGPACVVDFGTATTFDAISPTGDYLGGAIAPGIGIASQALFQRTAMLPRVELARPPSAIGRNTVHSMQSGLLFGYVSLVEGMVARFRAELGPDTRVIGTGGLAEIIARETEVIQILAPWLTLDGLRMVYEMNRGAQD